jgi:hypothetical protein
VTLRTSEYKCIGIPNQPTRDPPPMDFSEKIPRTTKLTTPSPTTTVEEEELLRGSDTETPNTGDYRSQTSDDVTTTLRGALTKVSIDPQVEMETGEAEGAAGSGSPSGNASLSSTASNRTLKARRKRNLKRKEDAIRKKEKEVKTRPNPSVVNWLKNTPRGVAPLSGNDSPEGRDKEATGRGRPVERNAYAQADSRPSTYRNAPPRGADRADCPAAPQTVQSEPSRDGCEPLRGNAAALKGPPGQESGPSGGEPPRGNAAAWEGYGLGPGRSDGEPLRGNAVALKGTPGQESGRSDGEPPRGNAAISERFRDYRYKELSPPTDPRSREKVRALGANKTPLRNTRGNLRDQASSEEEVGYTLVDGKRKRPTKTNPTSQGAVAASSLRDRQPRAVPAGAAGQPDRRARPPGARGSGRRAAAAGPSAGPSTRPTATAAKPTRPTATATKPTMPPPAMPAPKRPRYSYASAARQELVMRVVDRTTIDREMTRDDLDAVRTLIDHRNLALAKGKEQKASDGEAAPTFVPSVERLLLLKDPHGLGEIRIYPSDQDTHSWLQVILNDRDCRFATQSYKDLPKWKTAAIFVPTSCLRKDAPTPESWWAEFRQALRGHYKVKDIEMTKIWTQLDRDGKLAGYNLLIMCPKTDLLKFARRTSVAGEYRISHGAARYDVRERGDTLPPLSYWQPTMADDGEGDDADAAMNN